MRHLNSYFRTALLAPAILLTAMAPLQASDQDLRVENTIKNSYNFKTYLSRDDIAVHASAGVVTLSGMVLETSDRWLAAETAAESAGVKSVINELKVKPDQPTEQSDGWITMKVKTALAYHKHVSAAHTDVATVAGVVTLKGEVDTESQKELTTEYAKDVEGVKQVNNLQTVTGAKPERTVGTQIDDASITAQIKANLLFHSSTHAVATEVKTRSGVVTLRGEARNAAEKALVGKLAEDTNGVVRVDNRMTIQKS
ncbi:MAG: BON domain-containing protein [Holophaga sp.]|nr:BON domain-containing protein [Holophaga sp.]